MTTAVALGLVLFVCEVAISGASADETAVVSLDPQSELRAWVDRKFSERAANSGRPISKTVDDGTFLRRVNLDLAGVIPSVSQARDFLADQTPNKRELAVDRLLGDPRTSKHLARVWRRMMVPGNGPEAQVAISQLEPWIAQQFAANTPYDEFARELLAPRQPVAEPMAVRLVNSMTPPGSSAAGYRIAVGGGADVFAGASTRFFLGVSLNCAKCHDHPFAKWKKSDFWGMAAFFAPNTPERLGLILTDAGETYPVKFLGGESPAVIADVATNELLAKWMTAADNPSFAVTAVNRVWLHLHGHGAVSEVDDLDRVSAEERSFLVDELGSRFAAKHFDFRWLISAICKSDTYQREAVSPEESLGADPLVKRPLKTLLPEQVFDSLEQALNLPLSRNDENNARQNGERAVIVNKLNEAATNHPEQFRSGIPQALVLMHGATISKATNLETSRTLRAVVEAPFFPPEKKIEALYLATLTRKPEADELEAILEFINERAGVDEQKEAYSEVFWALLNSPEFVLSR